MFLIVASVIRRIRLLLAPNQNSQLDQISDLLVLYTKLTTHNRLAPLDSTYLLELLELSPNPMVKLVEVILVLGSESSCSWVRSLRHTQFIHHKELARLSLFWKITKDFGFYADLLDTRATHKRGHTFRLEFRKRQTKNNPA